jgi:hypothetical protein
MAETHDTIDKLLAEFRGYSSGMPASYHVTMSWADFRRMLDCFDAAYRRERNRNFHRFATAEEAVKAWQGHEAKDKGAKFCDGCPFDLGAECAKGGVCSIGWLYVKAQEGGAK